LQIIALFDVNNGFKLPMITSNNQKCPASFPQISASGDILTPLAGVKTPVWKTDHYKLYPIDTSQNSHFTFWVYSKTEGKTGIFFGPYEMAVGCSTRTVTMWDAADLITNIDLFVGDAGDNAFNFKQPLSSASQCGILYHIVVKPDGSSLSGLLSGDGSPFFNVISTAEEKQIEFAI
jgi:hypothetical protein